ncbi:hypothetical protein CIN_02520 [Commensalibacter intestini A911]|uniref:Methyltransferase type 11 domain-containing protein n=1 Tax=Commensalibacter intestini A911 TaxID=1088868 RepID=G6EXT2_9PROT|nr:hypothetical protein [Commensalibacter intestini]EHD14320.1 hypothetical protein CIN_02520 [Commensalibacter intestini A911]
MVYDINSILIHKHEKKQGITTYLQHKLAQIWPDLYGLSFLSTGQTLPLIPRNIWYPHDHIHGIFNITENNYLKYLTGYNPQICCFSIVSFPFQDCSIDRILYIHDKTITKEQFDLFLRSCWKTLSDDGKIILLLPNKLGWWSVIENISLRYRNTFFIQKLNIVLKQQMFRISHYEKVLYFPPRIMNIASLRTNRILEFIGLFFVPFGGGYHLIEIEKNLYAPITVAPLKKNYILRKKLSKTSLNLRDSDS